MYKNPWEFGEKIPVKIGDSFSLCIYKDESDRFVAEPLSWTDDLFKDMKDLLDGYVLIHSTSAYKAEIIPPHSWSVKVDDNFKIQRGKDEEFSDFLKRIYEYIELVNAAVLPVYDIGNKNGVLCEKSLGFMLPPKDKYAPHFFMLKNESVTKEVFCGNRIEVEVQDDLVPVRNDCYEIKVEKALATVCVATLYLHDEPMAYVKQPLHGAFWVASNVNEAIKKSCKIIMDWLVCSAAHSKVKSDEHLVVKFEKNRKQIYGASVDGLRYIGEGGDYILSTDFVRLPWSILATGVSDKTSYGVNVLSTHVSHSMNLEAQIRSKYQTDLSEGLLTAAEAAAKLEHIAYPNYTQFLGFNRSLIPVTELGRILFEKIPNVLVYS